MYEPTRHSRERSALATETYNNQFLDPPCPPAPPIRRATLTGVCFCGHTPIKVSGGVCIDLFVEDVTTRHPQPSAQMFIQNRTESSPFIKTVKHTCGGTERASSARFPPCVAGVSFRGLHVGPLHPRSQPSRYSARFPLRASG